MLSDPLELVPPILRPEKSLPTGGIGNGGRLDDLKLVVGKVDGVRQKSRFLHRISYELARLCRERERLC